MIRRAGIALLVATAACGGAGPESRPVGPVAALAPAWTYFGDPVAVGTTAAVAEAGATLRSPDGALSISVPPDALATTTSVSITGIVNMARGAIGPAYRLGPEGTTFATPVTLTFKFQEPERYPTGTSFAGVGVSYQDASGFWHAVEPVTRDPIGKTVSVTTTHFSDWALTWGGGTAAAEGPISLDQTLGTPLTATGTATVFFLSDDPYDQSYGLTGTLTLQPAGATYTVEGATCVPVQRTLTLPLNVAEVHKSTPPVFRWGIGVHWTLTCSDLTTRLLPATFDTMGINPPVCPGDYAAGQVVSADQLAGTFVKNCGGNGLVSATWDLRTCWDLQVCSTGVDCRVGTTVCSGGVATCVDDGPAPDSTACGPALAGTCADGVCTMP